MEERVTLGLTESIHILGNGNEREEIIARIDSGATASSIGLQLAEKLKLGPITRSKIVKSASGVAKRPIVKAQVHIGGKVLEEEFTLADRSHMTYQILIGQNILKKGKFLIDPLIER